MVKRLTIFVCLLFMQTTSQAQLSNQAKADLIQNLIMGSLEQKDFVRANNLFEKYDGLEPEMPHPLVLVKAQVLYQVGSYIDAKTNLENYINNAGREDKNYQKALKIYPEISQKALEQEELLAEESRLKAEEEERRKQQELAKFIQALEDSMLLIPAGNFMMGARSGPREEKPTRQVFINKPFYIHKYEATTDLWNKCSSFGGCSRELGEGQPQLPITEVSWNEVTSELIPWLNSISLGGFRLPTEAEWEWSARGGVNTKYWWGDQALCALANYGAAESCENNLNKSKDVGSYAKNSMGLFDVHGNVYEMVADCYHANYRKAPKNQAAWLAEDKGDCESRMIRGGAWSSSKANIKLTHRATIPLNEKRKTVGFRLAQDRR